MKRYVCAVSIALFMLFSYVPARAEITYEQYLHTVSEIEFASDSINLSGIAGIIDETRPLDYGFTVSAGGMYNIRLKYRTMGERPVLAEIYFNGVLPYRELGQITLRSFFQDEGYPNAYTLDLAGNDLRPSQIRLDLEADEFLYDTRRYHTAPLAVYLPAGSHTITVVCVSGSAEIISASLEIFEQPPFYDDYILSLKAKGVTEYNGTPLMIEAEKAFAKTDASLFPTSDRTSPMTSPYRGTAIVFNTLGGGGRWNIPGQSVSWEVDVPETGLYKLMMRVRQNFARGTLVSRVLRVDGVIPFAEAASIRFDYARGWQTFTLGGDEPMLLYLEKGTRVISMEAVLGDAAPLIRTATESLLSLNDMVRSIVMYTGQTPDPYRDYLVDERLPEVMVTLREQLVILEELQRTLIDVTGKRGQSTAMLGRLCRQLEDLIKRPDTIPARLDALRNNIQGLGAWINNAVYQPLEIDTLTLCAPDEMPPRADVGFFTRIWHEIKLFIASYLTDFSTIGTSYAANGEIPRITVWTTAGRDQSQILKQMIDNDFSPKNGIAVNLRIVQPGVLMSAVAAGVGPDVALNNVNSDPVNYATRNAAVDLSGFEGFNKVAERFFESALTPYRYMDGVYALPEQQNFMMMFVRTDILSEMELAIPKTWDDMILVISELQRRNMNFAIPVSNVDAPGGGFPSYLQFLYQFGGQLYREDGIASALDERPALDAFRFWCSLYQHYNLPFRVDFANRFRTGELPVIVQDYTFYNLISVFAPELAGRWQMTAVPGTLRDGVIDNTTPSFGTACMLLASSRLRDEAWLFMDWWTSADVQTQYGREMESILGTAGRYPTANREAASQLPWKRADWEALLAQWENVRGVPEVPGGYFTPRHLDNAFRRVVIHRMDFRETLLDYVRIINTEITSKRQEFGLPVRQTYD
jgi:ABC-type glycerol-3-phosphate transport system substrate-binding protein